MGPPGLHLGHVSHNATKSHAPSPVQNALGCQMVHTCIKRSGIGGRLQEGVGVKAVGCFGW